MAQRKIIWSQIAKIRLFEILDFYNTRNKSRRYSEKLYREFVKQLSLVDKHPEMGIRTEMDAIRGLIIGHFILFHEVKSESILVHTVWDSRQNPEKLKL